MDTNIRVVGEWNGELIWQYKTAGDRLSELTDINMSKIKDYKETKQEEFNDIESSLQEDKNRNTRLYLLLMEGKITNKEFELLTGAEPTEDNPSRKDWEDRNK